MLRNDGERMRRKIGRCDSDSKRGAKKRVEWIPGQWVLQLGTRGTDEGKGAGRRARACLCGRVRPGEINNAAAIENDKVLFSGEANLKFPTGHRRRLVAGDRTPEGEELWAAVMETGNRAGLCPVVFR